MILKSLKLQNVRSYTNQHIEFPEGSVLLAGDIGSGKSSILQSIEFALFGILRGSSSGSDILRHGANEGSVELSFILDGKPVVIKRSLKRGKNGVAQTAGYIIQNDQKREGTPIELKAWMIDLLGYHKDFITKSKSLVYRYTVYTPQEEMKAILFEEKELRLDTLRKVFGIDKYKRIRENAIIYSKELKTRVRELQIKVQEEPGKKQRKETLESESKVSREKLQELIRQQEHVRTQTKIAKSKLEDTELQKKTLDDLKAQYALLTSQLKNKVQFSARSKQQIELLDQEITKIELILKEVTPFDESLLRSKQTELVELEKQKIALSSKESVLSQQIDQSNSLKTKITSLDNCPLCLQNVAHTHKDQITQNEDKKIIDLRQQQKSITKQYIELNEQIVKTKAAIEELQKQKTATAVNQLRIKQLDQKKKDRERILEEASTIKKDVGELNGKRMELQPKIESLKDLETQYLQYKELYDKKLREERDVDVRVASLKKEVEYGNTRIDELQKELEGIAAHRERQVKTRQLLQWIEESFMNLMIVMEKHVMMNIYHEFNELFMKWFDMLIEDQNIHVRLDDEFTPTVIQNGYETDMSSLSGGEKTSLALAYRLSLNKVINNMMEHVQTKELIILDEPTEGFSADQLDKVRDVLREINMKQIMIVSHESKIESYVDHVIRVAKHEHVSKVLQ